MTESIPNDPIILRKDLKPEMKKKIIDAFLAFVATPDGKETFSKVYGVTDLKTATDADYDSVRDMLKKLGKSAGDLMKK